MGDLGAPTGEAGDVAFEAYGVAAVVSASPADLLARVEPLLPPGWRACRPSSSDREFSVAQRDGGFEVRVDDVGVVQSPDLDLVLGVLDAELRAHVAFQAPDRIFVHAGVVGLDGGAIVLPGPSFSGKTTLVAALVRQGAAYYSDEYAVLDERGLVHPYPKPLSIRQSSPRGTDYPVSALGGSAGSEPLRVALIAATSYRPDARWDPETISPGAGALALLSNTVPARDRPAEALSAVRQASDAALVLEGERGEAEEVAADLLGRMRAGTPL